MQFLSVPSVNAYATDQPFELSSDIYCMSTAMPKGNSTGTFDWSNWFRVSVVRLVVKVTSSANATLSSEFQETYFYHLRNIPPAVTSPEKAIRGLHPLVSRVSFASPTSYRRYGDSPVRGPGKCEVHPNR